MQGMRVVIDVPSRAMHRSPSTSCDVLLLNIAYAVARGYMATIRYPCVIITVLSAKVFIAFGPSALRAMHLRDRNYNLLAVVD